MIYLQTLLKRHDEEITRKVYICQKSSPLPGDWCQLVAEDFSKMNIHMSDEQIAQMQEDDYKKLIKRNVHDTAFHELQQFKGTHSKVWDNYYSDLQHIQPYFTNRKLSFRQISMMFSLRSKTKRNIRLWSHEGDNRATDRLSTSLWEVSQDSRRAPGMFRPRLQPARAIHYSHAPWGCPY